MRTTTSVGSESTGLAAWRPPLSVDRAEAAQWRPMSLRPTVSVEIPPSLRRFVDGRGTVEVDAASVREALEALEASHPGIKAKLCDGDGNVRRAMAIYANQEDVRFLDNLDTALGDGTALQLVPVGEERYRW